ncbi:MAG: NADH-quinone oxidoreductase subunit J [Gammaproteobacteria bacterium]|nr:NADH-quinone oxidoreductase subunit J [Gammaproteobacteria bacterium]
MTFEQLLFYSFAAVLIAAAIGVITSRNPVHSVLFLVLAFFNSAVLWMLLEAEFLAIVLVLVYVGAVMVLFLFVVMMLDINVARAREGFTRYAPLGALVTIVVAVEIAYVARARQLGVQFFGPPERRSVEYSNTEEIGKVLYTEHVYAFEIAAVILLVAIVAAISLTMRKRPNLKVQDIGKQVATRRGDRVRIVKMKSESPD